MGGPIEVHMNQQRMVDGSQQPTDRDVLVTIGRRAELWSTLRDYLAKEYDHDPELLFGGKKYGWCYRYRRGGRTLVTLYPEHDSFTVLVVLGKQEVDTARRVLSEQSARVRTAFSEARQLPDGRWLWIRPAFPKDIRSIAALLAFKRRTKSQRTG